MIMNVSGENYFEKNSAFFVSGLRNEVGDTDSSSPQ